MNTLVVIGAFLILMLALGSTGSSDAPTASVVVMAAPTPQRSSNFGSALTGLLLALLLIMGWVLSLVQK